MLSRPLFLVALCALPVAAQAAVVTLELSPQRRVEAHGSPQGLMLDVASLAAQAVGGPWLLRGGRLTLSFADDGDPLVDLGLLGYDGQTVTSSARRETRDGRSGIVTYQRTTEYQARGFEDAAERAVIRAEGLSGEAASAGRQAVLGETPPELQGTTWSGWTCHWWGCSGTETQRYTAERWRGTLYDGSFDFGAELGRDALAALQRDGRWWLEVGAGLGDFQWRHLRLELDVVRGPAAVVDTAPSLALALLGLGLLGAARRRRTAG